MDKPSIREISLGDLLKEDAGKYVIPRYQREYAWNDEQVSRLLTDLWCAYKSNEENGTSRERRYYLGSLVVKPRKDGTWETIDGQQRLTTISLLFGIMGNSCHRKPLVSFDTRKYCNDFLAMYCANGNIPSSFTGDKRLSSFISAIRCMQEFKLQDEDGIETKVDLACADFRKYLLSDVILFRVQMPISTDAMAYFEVMNNRGEQLEDHELLKAWMLECLHEQVPGNEYQELSGKFNRIWTACSRMDGNLVDHLHACYEIQIEPERSWTELAVTGDCQGDADEDNVPYERQSVLREFSQFLMHVIRLYVKKHPDLWKSKIQLDERKLSDFKELKFNAVEFLQLLVCTRLDFDRYVVKAKMNSGKVEGWRLKEIVRGVEGAYYPRKTYSENPVRHDQIVCLQSALQVSNADQRYKEWVFDVLSMGAPERANPDMLLKVLEKGVAQRIRVAQSKVAADCDYFAQGLSTSRLLLNIVDYLMWTASQAGMCSKKESPDGDFFDCEPFNFTYQNSIEHHHPQNCRKIGKEEEWHVPKGRREGYRPEHDIGNLYLTSTSENSSMSNSIPRDKVTMYCKDHKDELPVSPKRRWMYRQTRDKGRWEQGDMERLSAYVKKIVNAFLGKYPAPAASVSE